MVSPADSAVSLAVQTVSMLWAIPFTLMLLSIAVFPLALPGWWERNLNKFWIALVLGMPVLIYYLKRNPPVIFSTGEEFISFIILLASLYIVAGGILLTGDLQATPQTNVAMLAMGTMLASLIGTTGASLLMIRAVLKTNSERVHRVHTIVFFIFLVSNIGGALTPLGDPPLFVGYLEGVPFHWTLRLFPEWAAVSAGLLLLYFIWDTVMYSREPIAALELDRLRVQPLRLAGKYNFLFLLAIVLSVVFLKRPIRETAMVVTSALSLIVTPRELRQAHRFTYYPIIEVTVLFFGIFLTMIPALEIVRARAGYLGIREPWHFFWVSGGVSSFLDNTPTYLMFLNLARGLAMPREVAGVSHSVLRAISLGAVFMGANTYIGNAPNFMVRSVAEESGLKMPSFFGYMLYSAAVLIPIFVAVTLVFL
ncbi:MAG TPA: sodium:proton antiporter [Acidobacteriota bacterium]|jgi:Na+/H+ antiporter NhaD/arsenite permease-like protein|nr:sodium:proton antiporter [Acidobacteriota bacterium]